MNPFIKFLFGKPSVTVTLAETAKQQTCTNCGATLSGPYCSHCGQKKEAKHDFSISHFLGETVHAFTHFDSKFFRSFKYLVFKPGELTREYFAGHRKSFMHPLQLFLVINILYFLLLSALPLPTMFSTQLYYQIHSYYGKVVAPTVNDKLKSTGITYKDYEKEFNHKTEEQARSLIIIMVPLFAFLLSLLFWSQKRYYIEHLVFSLHFYSFILIFMTLGVVIIDFTYFLASAISLLLGASIHRSVNFLISTLLEEDNSALITSIILLFYVFLAIKKAYNNSNMVSAFKALVCIIFFWYILLMYRFLLFYTTFYGLRLSLH